MNRLSVSFVLAVLQAISHGATCAYCQQSGRGAPEDERAVANRFNVFPAANASAVDAFEFEFSLSVRREDQYLMKWQTVLLTARAVKKVSSEVGSAFIDVTKGSQPGLVGVTLSKLHAPVEEVGERTLVPEKWFEIPWDTLSFPRSLPIYLRLRFRDAEEYFALAFDRDRGLRLVGVKNRFGKVKRGAIKEFDILETKEGARVYECNNLGITAREDQTELWKRRIPLEGAPKELRVVGQTLFVLSTKGHSLYVRKRDGKIIFYHEGTLAGKSPWDEILELARQAYRRETPQRVFLARYMTAAALLEEKRAAPFLIECIEKGFGLSERWLAVAALEHLNGNSQPWKDTGEGQPWDPLGWEVKWDVDRVYPDSAAKAEAKKWGKVFGKVEKPLLTRPQH